MSEHEECGGGSVQQVEGDDAEQRGRGHQVTPAVSTSLSLTQILLSSDIESGMFSDCRLSKITIKLYFIIFYYFVTAEPSLASQGLSNKRAIYQPVQGDSEHWDGQLL